MILHDIKLILRNIFRKRLFSFINLLGLSIGLAASILIFLWVKDELSFDKHHKDHESIYRLIVHFKNPGNPLYLTSTPPALLPTIQQEIPDIKKGSRLAYYELTVKSNDDLFLERIYYIDKDFFDILTFPVIAGDLTTFDEPNTLIITERMAKKYFGDTNPIGKTLIVDGNDNLTIKAVIKDCPKNSSYQLDFIAPIAVLKSFGYDDNNWNSWGWTAFIKLNTNQDQQDVQQKINDIVLKQSDHVEEILLQPIGNIHLYQRNGNPGQLKNVYIFSSISIIILLIACFNYMNLSTAKSMVRTKETSIRKILGSSKRRLIYSFLLESITFSLFSLIIALILIELIRPYFNNLADKNIAIAYNNLKFLFLLIGITLSTGILAGLYPAIKLSGFNGSQLVGKGNQLRNKKGLVRQILVITQFTTGIILIAGTLIVSKQLRYMLNKELGIDHKNIVYFKIDGGDIQNNFESFKQELLNNPEVLNITRTYQMPSHNMLSADFRDVQDENDIFPINISIGDHDYLKTFGLEIVKGRDFSLEFATDSFNFIINEKAASLIQENDLIGRKTSLWYEGQIIGIMKDYHFMPLNNEIEPIAILIDPSMYEYGVVKISPENKLRTIKIIEETFKTYAGDFPFELKYMDNDYTEIYQNENQQSTLFRYFSILAIFVACLGLFGLSAFIAEQKTKEIAVRKVNGASVSGIIILMSKQFIKWVMIAIIIATPIAWYWMNGWLDQFVYRVNLGSSAFIISGLIALGIAFLTTAIHALKAANRNPVESLRYE